MSRSSRNQINWHSLEATNYRFREDPSTENSLGVVRININNPYGVYMHDTPAKGVFGDDFRFVSSGCMRMQNVRDYVAWLLKNNPGWDRDHIDQAIASGERLDVKIEPPVNVYWVYITAWGTPEGLVQFREDIYQRDGFSTVAGGPARRCSVGRIRPRAAARRSIRSRTSSKTPDLRLKNAAGGPDPPGRSLFRPSFR